MDPLYFLKLMVVMLKAMMDFVRIVFGLVWLVFAAEFPSYNAFLTSDKLATLGPSLFLVVAWIVDKVFVGTDLEKVETSIGPAYRFAMENGVLVACLFLVLCWFLSRALKKSSFVVTVTMLLGVSSVILVNLVAYVYIHKVMAIYYAWIRKK